MGFFEQHGGGRPHHGAQRNNDIFRARFSDTENTTDTDNTCSFPKWTSPDRHKVPGPISTSRKPKNGPRGHFSSSEKHILVQPCFTQHAFSVDPLGVSLIFVYFKLSFFLTSQKPKPRKKRPVSRNLRFEIGLHCDHKDGPKKEPILTFGGEPKCEGGLLTVRFDSKDFVLFRKIDLDFGEKKRTIVSSFHAYCRGDGNCQTLLLINVHWLSTDSILLASCQR